MNSGTSRRHRVAAAALVLSASTLVLAPQLGQQTYAFEEQHFDNPIDAEDFAGALDGDLIVGFNYQPVDLGPNVLVDGSHADIGGQVHVAYEFLRWIQALGAHSLLFSRGFKDAALGDTSTLNELLHKPGVPDAVLHHSRVGGLDFVPKEELWALLADLKRDALDFLGEYIEQHRLQRARIGLLGHYAESAEAAVDIAPQLARRFPEATIRAAIIGHSNGPSKLWNLMVKDLQAKYEGNARRRLIRMLLSDTPADELELRQLIWKHEARYNLFRRIGGEQNGVALTNVLMGSTEADISQAWGDFGFYREPGVVVPDRTTAVVTPWGLDDRWTHEPQPFDEQLAPQFASWLDAFPDPDAPLGIMIARGDERKNRGAAIEALNHLEVHKGVNLILTFPLDVAEADLDQTARNERDQIHKAIAGLPEKDRRRVRLVQNFSEGASFYRYLIKRGITFFKVVPSTHEPFGLTLIEAMRMGAPVVATAFGGPWSMLRPDLPPSQADELESEILIGKAGALVTPTDPRSIAAGIDAVLTHHHTMSQAAMIQAREYTYAGAVMKMHRALFPAEGQGPQPVMTRADMRSMPWHQQRADAVLGLGRRVGWLLAGMRRTAQMEVARQSRAQSGPQPERRH